MQPPFGVAKARAEDERQQQGKGGEVGGGTVMADFVVDPGGDDDGEENGIGSAAAQAYGGEGCSAAEGLYGEVLGEIGEVAEVQKPEAECGEHG